MNLYQVYQYCFYTPKVLEYSTIEIKKLGAILKGDVLRDLNVSLSRDDLQLLIDTYAESLKQSDKNHHFVHRTLSTIEVKEQIGSRKIQMISLRYFFDTYRQFYMYKLVKELADNNRYDITHLFDRSGKYCGVLTFKGDKPEPEGIKDMGLYYYDWSEGERMIIDHIEKETLEEYRKKYHSV